MHNPLTDNETNQNNTSGNNQRHSFGTTFDRRSSWTVGQWKASNRMVYLNIENVYGPLKREGKPDSLVFSFDEKSNRFKLTNLLSNKSALDDKADELIE